MSENDSLHNDGPPKMKLITIRQYGLKATKMAETMQNNVNSDVNVMPHY